MIPGWNSSESRSQDLRRSARPAGNCVVFGYIISLKKDEGKSCMGIELHMSASIVRTEGHLRVHVPTYRINPAALCLAPPHLQPLRLRVHTRAWARPEPERQSCYIPEFIFLPSPPTFCFVVASEPCVKKSHDGRSARQKYLQTTTLVWVSTQQVTLLHAPSLRHARVHCL